MRLQLVSSGGFPKTQQFLAKLAKPDILPRLREYGKLGAEALRSTTPQDTGETASAWDYKVESKDGVYTISWTNSKFNQGVPIAIILQYGHGTPTGGWVQGRDYINPAIQPVMDKIADNVWRVVTSG